MLFYTFAKSAVNDKVGCTPFFCPVFEIRAIRVFTVYTEVRAPDGLNDYACENLRVPESDDTRCVIKDAKTIGSKLEFTKHFEYDVLYEKHPKEHKTTTL